MSKVDAPRTLLAAILGAAGASLADEALPPKLKARAAARLDPTDRAILAMRLAGTPAADVGATLGIGCAAVDGRLLAIIVRLTPPGQASLASATVLEDGRSDPPRITPRPGSRAHRNGPSSPTDPAWTEPARLTVARDPAKGNR